jgi:hypothetical protein
MLSELQKETELSIAKAQDIEEFMSLSKDSVLNF